MWCNEIGGINCVLITFVGTNCASNEKTTIIEGRLLESSTRACTCVVVETMLSHAINGVKVLVALGTLLVKCCYDELGMINEYRSLCRIVDSSNLTFHMIMIFLSLSTQQ
jgi:hypothetical protein